MPKVEITMDQLLTDYDWAQVFADENAGNVNKDTRPAVPGSTVDLTPPTRADVVEIVAAVNSENDGASWEGAFRLRDGRWLFAEGGCDYTGWDCQASNSLTVATSLDELLVYGMSEQQAERLGLAGQRLAVRAGGWGEIDEGGLIG